MRLTNTALQAINQRKVKRRLAFELDFSGVWITSLIEANKVNGPLTTAKSLDVIQEETGLTKDQILEEEQVATTKE